MNLEPASNTAEAAIEVKAGETTTVRIGGGGRTIRGKLQIPDAVAKLKPFTRVARIASTEDPDRPERFAHFRPAADGSFEIHDIEPGEYELSVVLTEMPRPGDAIDTMPPLGMAKAKIIFQDQSEPLDVGTVEIKPTDE
jgi:hypothetical protein